MIETYGKIVWKTTQTTHKSVSKGSRIIGNEGGGTWNTTTTGNCDWLEYGIVQRAGYYYNIEGSSFNPFWQSAIVTYYKVSVLDNQEPQKGDFRESVKTTGINDHEDGEIENEIWYVYKGIE